MDKDQKQEQDVSSQIYEGFIIVLRLLELAAIIAGVLFLVRIIYLFFGALAAAPGFDWLISTTDKVVEPLGIETDILTPYDGVFDLVGAGVLLSIMVVEFVFSSIRASLQKNIDRTLIREIAAKASSAEAEPASEKEKVTS